MRQSARLVVNLISLLGRMALTIGISLLVTRLLLQTVGEVDFGLILALGATGALLQFITGALTASLQRQLSWEIATGNRDAIARVFSTGWVVFMTMGGILWLIGIALTPVMMNVLTIPAGRADAAWWVYQISLLTLVLVVTGTPYQALLVAHQHLTVQSIADALTALTRLAAVLLVWVVPWDPMIAFVALQLAGYATVRWSLNAYCLWRYEGSWPRPRDLDRNQLKQIFGIAIWSLFGQLSWRIRLQGGILLLNVFFGPVVNAGYGIATQVAGYAGTISYSLRQSVLPAIVGAYAKGNRQSVHRLALVAGKYTVFMLSFLFVPLWLEADQVLRLWLGELPAYTIIFTRLVLIWMIGHMLTSGYVMANMATGEVGWYTRRGLLIVGLSLTAAAVGFYFGLPPWFLPVTAMVDVSIIIFIAVTGVGAKIELPPTRWLYESFLPTLGVLVPAIAAACIVHLTLPDGLARLFAVGATFAVVAAPLIWWIGLAAWEREKFLGLINSAVNRLQRATQARPRT